MGDRQRLQKTGGSLAGALVLGADLAGGDKLLSIPLLCPSETLLQESQGTRHIRATGQPRGVAAPENLECRLAGTKKRLVGHVLGAGCLA